VKFLIDAQLPKSLAVFLHEKGFDAIHTLELPNRNATKDSEIRLLSVQEERIVISKDADFYNSYTSKQEPYKLVYLTIGNLSNKELLRLFDRNLSHLIAVLDRSSVIEMNQHFLITLF
jgi:predicted nuclease of predicted toxin-antitoxin system